MQQLAFSLLTHFDTFVSLIHNLIEFLNSKPECKYFDQIISYWTLYGKGNAAQLGGQQSSLNQLSPITILSTNGFAQLSPEQPCFSEYLKPQRAYPREHTKHKRRSISSTNLDML